MYVPHLLYPFLCQGHLGCFDVLPVINRIHSFYIFKGFYTLGKTQHKIWSGWWLSVGERQLWWSLSPRWVGFSRVHKQAQGLEIRCLKIIPVLVSLGRSLFIHKGPRACGKTAHLSLAWVLSIPWYSASLAGLGIGWQFVPCTKVPKRWSREEVQPHTCQTCRLARKGLHVTHPLGSFLSCTEVTSVLMETQALGVHPWCYSSPITFSVSDL